MTDGQIIDRARVVLEALDGRRRWMTAGALSRRLRKEPHRIRVSQLRLYDLLEGHAARGNGRRQIRNSLYPSIRTLEVLWGAIARVGDREVPPPRLELDGEQARADLPADRDDPELLEETEGAATHFLSYNSNDRAEARQIVELLDSKGHAVWMAGKRIAEGEVINAEVIDAIREASTVVLYLSATALKSLWVAKEQIVAEALALPRVLVVRGDDPELIGLVRHWAGLEPVDDAAERFRDILDYRGPTQGAAVEFRALLARHLGEGGRLYLYPEAGRSDGERLLDLASYPETDRGV